VIELEQMVIELSEAFGPSGFEGEVRQKIASWVGEYTNVTYDHFGSLIAVHSGTTMSPKVMLAAHMDEVGLMVRGILPGGELRVVTLGSWWPPSLLAQPVVIRSREGDRLGVIGAKPPHYLREEERNRQLKLDDLYIDVGARSAAEVQAMGIAPGDPVVPAVQTRPLSGQSVYMGKAFDDRLGCAVLANVLQTLGSHHPNQVVGVATVQEEVGLRGAKAVSSVIQPDICIVLEGVPADDFPGNSIVQGRMGGGPQIRRFDPTMIANQALVDLLIDTAQQSGIPYQVAVRESGGTDASAIQVHTHGGVPTTVIGIPVRYAHSHQGIADIRDVSHTAALVREFIFRLDLKTVNHLKQNPW